MNQQDILDNISAGIIALTPALTVSAINSAGEALLQVSASRVIGEPICRGELTQFNGDPKAMMDFLREATYRLSPRPLPDYGYGYEFEEKHKS